MILTPDNYRSFAEEHLIRKDVFEEVLDGLLKIPTRISKNITRHKNGEGNLRIMINDSVIFLNAFKRREGAAVLTYLVGDRNSLQVKSIIQLLGIEMDSYDHEFLNELKVEIGL